MDRDTLWAFLSTEAYWGRWRTRSVVEQQLDSAWRVVGVYQSGAGAMVGFARAVSDGAGFAYLADVYIDKEYRGQGLGVELVATMIDRGPGASFRWTLHTSDAHGLYERFGFTQPDRTYLERPGTAPGHDAEVVALEHQAQPDQGEPRLVRVDDAHLVDDQRGQPAGGDDRHRLRVVRGEFGGHPPGDALDLARRTRR